MSWAVASAVAAGGALGALGRYVVNVLAERVLSFLSLGQIPLATFTVNMAGSFLMGLLAGGLLLRFPSSEALRAFLATGLLGGFTTFSAFSLELGEMVTQRHYGMALGYGSASVVLGLCAFLLGMSLVRVWA